MRRLLPRLACLWYGHTDILQAEPIKLSLHCTSCGRSTPGWTLDTPRPVRRWAKLLRFRKRLKAA